MWCHETRARGACNSRISNRLVSRHAKSRSAKFFLRHAALKKLVRQTPFKRKSLSFDLKSCSKKINRARLLLGKTSRMQTHYLNCAFSLFSSTNIWVLFSFSSDLHTSLGMRDTPRRQVWKTRHPCSKNCTSGFVMSSLCLFYFSSASGWRAQSPASMCQNMPKTRVENFIWIT